MPMFSGQFLALNLFSHVRRYSLSYKKYHNFPFLSPSFFFPFSFSLISHQSRSSCFSQSEDKMVFFINFLTNFLVHG